VPSIEPIAIVGIGCRFPRAESVAAYWDLLAEGRDAITTVPADRWDIGALYDPNPDVPGKVCTRWGGFLQDVDKFDAAFFAIPPREAERVDPQQRLILEVAWEALEDALIPPDKLSGSDTGVFVAISHAEYGRLINSEQSRIISYNGAGMYVSIAANRLSYVLNLQGPSMAVDTACSSSLVAIHLACQSLRSRESSLAIVGAVNLNLDPAETMGLTKARVLSPDGRCKTFDDSANGYVRSDGCGVVVLKRLSDAVSDGDSIRAVIRGSAVNQDGLTNGLTAPSGPAQQRVIGRALASAGVNPADVDYVEAHGTGTPLGDPIEMNSITAVYGKGRSAGRTCWVGSAKTNIGHLEAASGMAGLIKVVLALEHRQIPRNLHLACLNRYIKLEGKPFAIPTQSQPWPVREDSSGYELGLAGVSAFGFGGTNAHVILEEGPSRILEVLDGTSDTANVLALSAKTADALLQVVSSYQRLLTGRPSIELRNLCHSANLGRAHFNHRAAFIAGSSEDLLTALREFPERRTSAGTFSGFSRRRPKVAFLFTRGGGRYEGMGAELYRSSKLFKRAFDECADAYAAIHSYSPPIGLNEICFGPKSKTCLACPEHAEAAQFAIEYSLATVLRTWNIEPDILLGHGSGELAAAALAGVFTLECGMHLVTTRAKVLQVLPYEIAAPQIDAATRSVQLSRPKVRLVSNITGRVEDTLYCDSGYWRTYLTGEADFTSGLDVLRDEKNIVIMEINPQSAMNAAAGAGLGSERQLQTYAALRPGVSECFQLNGAAAFAYAVGVPIDWSKFEGTAGGQRIKLPTYPFQRSRHWYDATPRPDVRDPSPSRSKLFASALRPDAQTKIWHGTMAIETATAPFLLDHRVQGQTIVPGAAFIEIAAAAIEQISGVAGDISLCDVSFSRSCVLPQAPARSEIALAAEAGADSSYVLKITEAAAKSTLPYLTATLRMVTEDICHPAALDIASFGQPVPDAARNFYRRLADVGLEYGPCFRGIEALYTTGSETLGKVLLPRASSEDAPAYIFHPVLLDACLQVVGFAVEPHIPAMLMVPVAIEKMTLCRQPTEEVWCRVRNVKVGIGASKYGVSAEVEVFDSELRLLCFMEGFSLAPLVGLRAQTSDRIAEWQFDVTWHSSADVVLPSAEVAAGRLLLINAPESQNLAASLRGHFRDVLPQQYAPGAVNLSSDAFSEIVSAAVYCASADLRCETDAVESHSELLATECVRLRELVRDLISRNLPAGFRLLIVTTGAHAVGPETPPVNALHTALWGIGRTIAAEYPTLNCRLVDFDRIDAWQLAKELLVPHSRYQFAWRKGQRYEMALQRRRRLEAPVQMEFRATLARYADLSSWTFEKNVNRELGADEVLVSVAAVGLNFREVLVALGSLKSSVEDMGIHEARGIPFGGECAGTIVRVGSAVTSWSVADEVIVALTPGCLATTVVAKADRVFKKPSGQSFLSAATVSTAYLTAYYALTECVTLQEGQRVLIHAAAGAVGQACCQLAIKRGAKVIATASPPCL
jgi:acyl transferase domain-containing protein